MNKLNTILNGTETLFDSEWLQLADLFQVQWRDNLADVITLLSSTTDDVIFDDLSVADDVTREKSEVGDDT